MQLSFWKAGTKCQCDVSFDEKGFAVTSDRAYGSFCFDDIMNVDIDIA